MAFMVAEPGSILRAIVSAAGPLRNAEDVAAVSVSSSGFSDYPVLVSSSLVIPLRSAESGSDDAVQDRRQQRVAQKRKERRTRQRATKLAARAADAAGASSSPEDP
eukprot:TRINITY_DN39178_c0_g1_i4.p1 TRINITY_DN39178_c0_g1~~TRINITY_DN39178_c0_g1_i4.p1  ORF type:complete len:106 (-),score=7.87 TRINITY_DN39178_c0_g1_i4:174-491(-)